MKSGWLLENFSLRTVLFGESAKEVRVRIQSILIIFLSNDVSVTLLREIIALKFRITVKELIKLGEK